MSNISWGCCACWGLWQDPEPFPDGWGSTKHLLNHIGFQSKHVLTPCGHTFHSACLEISYLSNPRSETLCKYCGTCFAWTQLIPIHLYNEPHEVDDIATQLLIQSVQLRRKLERMRIHFENRPRKFNTLKVVVLPLFIILLHQFMGIFN